tara:strand:+ start:84 stop:386 length:303 start_codon:yes stop_codon:yes gene_type:complete
MNVFNLTEYLQKNVIQFNYNYGYGFEIKDFHYRKFLNFMASYPLSYNIDDEIKENEIENILLQKCTNKKYYKYGIKIITNKNIFYYDLEPIIKLSENKSL